MSDDYPTNEQLQIIREWDANNLDGLMEYIKGNVWHWPEYIFKNERGFWELHTGGWSGNEDIVEALRDNIIFWMMYWQNSKRGGHYLFCTTKNALKYFNEDWHDMNVASSGDPERSMMQDEDEP